jgi:stress-induced morphogen
MKPDQVESLIRTAFPDALLELKDLTGTQDHYELHLASAAFAGRSAIQQHRLVYAALGAHVGREIHALALHTYSPDAWTKRGT